MELSHEAVTANKSTISWLLFAQCLEHRYQVDITAENKKYINLKK